MEKQRWEESEKRFMIRPPRPMCFQPLNCGCKQQTKGYIWSKYINIIYLSDVEHIMGCIGRQMFIQFPQIGSFLCFAIKHQILSSINNHLTLSNINNHLTSLNIKKHMKHTCVSKKEQKTNIKNHSNSSHIAKHHWISIWSYLSENPMGVQDMEPTAEDLKQFAKEEPKAEEPPPEVGNLRCCWCWWWI